MTQDKFAYPRLGPNENVFTLLLALYILWPLARHAGGARVLADHLAEVVEDDLAAPLMNIP